MAHLHRHQLADLHAVAMNDLFLVAKLNNMRLLFVQHIINVAYR